MGITMQKLVGWRKFALVTLAEIASIVFVSCGIISGEQWVDLNKIIIPAALTANILEWWRRRKDADLPPSN